MCDSGGSNSARNYVFKEKLQEVANKISIEIRVAHFPSYCSKYNPIEHRLFPHVTRSCQGVIFQNIEIAKELMEKTATETGLKVFVSVNKKSYKAGNKASKGYKDNMKIVFDNYLPNLNYTAVPENSKVSSFYDQVFIHDKAIGINNLFQRTKQTLKQIFPTP